MDWKRIGTLWVAVACSAVCGCSAARTPEPVTESTSPPATVVVDAAAAPPAGADVAVAEAAAAGPATPRDVTLADAIALALERDPQLAAARAEAAAMEGELRQAGARPNPQLGVMTENVGGSGAYFGMDESETTLTFSQRFELGGKRSLRTRVAAHSVDAEEERVREREWTTISQVRAAFVEVLGAQAEVDVAVRAASRAGGTAADLERRRAAGAASVADVERARASVSRADIEAMERRADLAHARQRLTATWAAHESTLGRAVGDLEPLPPAPPLEDALARIDASPSLAIARADSLRARAELESARAEAVPDLTVGGGVRYLAGPDEVAFVAETALDLPLFDRREGATLAASERVRRADYEATRALDAARDAVATAHLFMTTAAEQARRLEREFLPGAARALDEFERGSALGTATYIDLVDAHRMLLELRLQHVRALVAFHRARAQMEAVVGPLAPDPETKGTVPFTAEGDAR